MKADMPCNNIQTDPEALDDFLTVSNVLQKFRNFRTWSSFGDRVRRPYSCARSLETDKTRGKSRSFLSYTHLSCVSRSKDVCWELCAVVFCVPGVFYFRREVINLSPLLSI